MCVYIGTNTKPLLMSLTSIESSQIEEPPAYTTAVQYPVSYLPSLLCYVGN